MKDFILYEVSRKIYSNTHNNFISKKCVVGMNKKSLGKIYKFFQTNRDNFGFRQSFVEYLKVNNFFKNKDLFILNTEYNSHRNTFRIKGFGDQGLLREFYSQNQELQQLRQETKTQNQKEYCRLTGELEQLKKIYNLSDNAKEACEFLKDSNIITWYQNQNGTWTLDMSVFNEKYVEELKYLMSEYNLNDLLCLEEVWLRDGKLLTEIFGNGSLSPNELKALSEEEICNAVEDYLISYIREKTDFTIGNTNLADELEEDLRKIRKRSNKEDKEVFMKKKKVEEDDYGPIMTY